MTTLQHLQRELINLTCPNQEAINRIMLLTEKQLKYKIANKKSILSSWDYEGDVLANRVNIIDA
jgi:hypothetical protein